MKGVRPWLVRWARRADTIDFPLLWLHWLAQYKYFALTVHYFNCALSSSNLGRLSLNVCLRLSTCDAGQIVIYVKKKREKKARIEELLACQ
jgi:hypothetical protein